MAQDAFACHDVLHAISDIHMGGVEGFQILKETQRLAGFIRRLSTERPGERLALVLNGDIVDTLAEDIGGYVATGNAVAIITRIMDDAAFAPIWQAMAAFVAQPRRTLVFNIGNHDIEIAFPVVQQLITSRLAGDDEAARGRIVFSTMGAGYGCVVGKARVHCTHGNEVDAWNFNRYEDLSRVGRRLNAGQAFDAAEWKPNAGTRMVKEVMNAVKQRYRWIDLLKPEAQAALGTLLVLDPGQAKNLADVANIAGQMKIEQRTQLDGRLSADGAVVAGADGAPPALESLLGSNLRGAAPARPPASDMLLAVEQALEAGPAAAPGAASPDGTLGTGQVVWDRLSGWLRGIPKDEALRRALKDWLKSDQSFNIEDRSADCDAVLPTIGSAVDIVIAGHTHLARAIDLGAGRMFFNSGTWIRLMRLSDAMLKDQASFGPIYKVLEDGRMPTIDGASFGGQPLLMDQTTAIEVSAEGGKVVGRLNRIAGDGNDKAKDEILRELSRA
jgi:UDP-2,3-diacylglucosamine pyrophosphatase LpxH